MVMEQQIRGASGSEVPVVKPEDAVPVVLPLGPIDRDEALLSPGTQEAVANHQVRKLVLYPHIWLLFAGFLRRRSGHGFTSRGGGTPRGRYVLCLPWHGYRWNGAWVDLGRKSTSPDPNTGKHEQSMACSWRPARHLAGVDLDAWCYGCKRDGLRGDIFWRVFAGCLLGSATRTLASCIILVPIWSQISLCKAHINPL
jgi:hypothetical protein